jgi:predicted N-acetyltransferase YhbS
MVKNRPSEADTGGLFCYKPPKFVNWWRRSLVAERTLIIRRMEEKDIERAGEIIVAAFNDVFTRHGYQPPFPSREVGISIARGYWQREPQESFVAIENNAVIGSGFLHLRDDTAGIGPITVDPTSQARGAGKELMMAVIRTARRCPSLRLVQDAFNTTSFPLYSKLGFASCGTVLGLSGKDFRAVSRPRIHTIRELTAADVEAVAALDAKLTGITRPQDLQFFAAQPPQLVSLVAGQLTGYLCMLRTGDSTFFGPAVATDSSILRSLIVRAAEMESGKALRMRLPARHQELFLDMLKMGFRVDHLQTYMVRGPWNVPKGTDLLAVFPEAL